MTLFIDDVLTFSMVLSLNFLNSGCSSLNQFYNVVCPLLSLLDLDFVLFLGSFCQVTYFLYLPSGWLDRLASLL